jgi:hypothetical protein
MQRVSPRAFVLALGATAGLLAGVLVVFMLLGGSGTTKVQATFGTPTAPPAATPVQSACDTVCGLADLDGGPGLYKCIAWTSSTGGSLGASGGNVETSLLCYSYIATNVGAGEPPCEASHSTGATPAPVVPGEGNCGGHSGAPPYSYLTPSKATGTYATADGGTVSMLFCYEDIGGSAGPNAIGRITYTGADAFQAAGNGATVSASADLWLNQTNAACTAAEGGTAPGGTPAPITFTLTKVSPDTRDFDGDGCADKDELRADKVGANIKCGDDPWNPYDPTSGAPLDVSGAYDIYARVTRSDVGTPGFYYSCKADMQQTGKNLTARAVCYVDSAAVTVNPQAANGNPAAGVNSCGPADPKYCGDGLPGIGPPGCSLASGCAVLANQGAGCPALPCDVSQYQFADIDDKQAVLTGTLDNDSNMLTLAGCFEDRDGLNALGNVYAVAKVNAHTGVGLATTTAFGSGATSQAHTDCVNGNVGAGVTVQVEIRITRQAPGDKSGGCVANVGLGYTGCRDSDGDGCPDKRELGDMPGGPTGGGLRDPYNRFDYFNPEKANTPHAQTVADILRVVGQYGKNQGNAAYTIDTDRTAIIGGNVWNLGPPDGQQTVADILAAVKQYNQNC